MTKMEFYQEIGENIRDLLEEYGISQKELADELGISKQTVSAYISGERKMTLDVFVNIIYTLDCDFDELIMIDSLVK